MSEKIFAYQYVDIEKMRKGILEKIGEGKLHREALNVFCFLTDSCLHKASGDCFPSYQIIAKAIGLSYKTVCKIMTGLVSWGILARVRVGFSNRFRTAFLLPDKWSAELRRSPPVESTPSPPPESTRSTPPEGGTINKGLLTKSSEQRGVTSSRPSDNSDLPDPHHIKPRVRDSMSHGRATGLVFELTPLGRDVDPDVVESVIIQLMQGLLTDEDATEILVKNSRGRIRGR